MNSLTINNLSFEVRWSSRRRTVGIVVDRHGDLVISAPVGYDASKLETFARTRLVWIYSKLAEKSARQHSSTPKEFVNGEGFWYLGKSYRLQLVHEQDQPLLLRNGRFLLRKDATEAARGHFIRWYAEHAQPWITARVEALSGRIGAKPARIVIRDLGNRWGSCGKGGVLYFHWALASLPPRIVDYLIVHELVHLRVKYHSEDFWRRVERVVPDYLNRKTWLAENGSQYSQL